MFLAEPFEQGILLRLIFRGQDREHAGETVTEVVQAGIGFASIGFWAGGVLSVGLIGGDLCWRSLSWTISWRR